MFSVDTWYTVDWSMFSADNISRETLLTNVDLLVQIIYHVVHC